MFLFRSSLEVSPVPDEPDFPTESDVDALLYEFKDDAREAIRALLHDLAVLAGDYEADVSQGYVRGHLYTLALRRAVGASE